MGLGHVPKTFMTHGSVGEAERVAVRVGSRCLTSPSAGRLRNGSETAGAALASGPSKHRLTEGLTLGISAVIFQTERD